MKFCSLQLKAACVLTILMEVKYAPRDEYGCLSTPLLWAIIVSALALFIALEYLIRFLSAKSGTSSFVPARIVAQNPAGSAKP